MLSDSAQAQRRSRSSTLRRPAQAARSAYEQGYQAGYNDGHNAGRADYNARLNRDLHRSGSYEQADRGYDSRYGNLNDFQDGYRLGYEIAYTDGYYGRTYNSALPPNALAMRSGGTNMAQNPGAYNSGAYNSVPPRNQGTATYGNQNSATYDGRPRAGNSIRVPDGTQLRLRLNTSLNTKTSREGDRFTATVVSPGTYEGATVEGHIAKLDRSGRLTGRTEMALDFDSISFRDGRSAPLHGQIEQVMANESVKSVDAEGNIETSNRTKDTEIRSIGGGALGAIIGGIAGGGKGAAIGAILGAGAGAGSVYVQGNKDLILDPGTEMTIRTSAPRRERLR